MQAAIAQGVTTGASELFRVCKELISSIKQGIDQIKINQVDIPFLFQKAGNLLRLAGECEELYNQCPCLDRLSQMELQNKLENIKDTLKLAYQYVPTNQEKKRFYNASPDKKIIDLLKEKLMEVDNELFKLKEELKKIHDRPRRPSTAVSDVDFPFPSKVTDFKAEAQGQYIRVSFTDDANEANDIKNYNIHIDGKIVDIYNPNPRINANQHSARTTSVFNPWQFYRVSITAVNKADQEGYPTEPITVLMDKSPPVGRPTGLMVVTALSRTSVDLSVDYPENFDEIAMEKCVVYVTMKGTTESQVAHYQESKDTLRFTVKNIDPACTCRVVVAFANQYGVGEQSGEITFKINSMKPSKPDLSVSAPTSDKAILTILTKDHPGNVVRYFVYKKQGFIGKFELVPLSQPVKPQGTDQVTCPINGLLPHKRYSFFVTSKADPSVSSELAHSDIKIITTPTP